ncbi:hypothetical protein GUITHDRAFT_150257 [Guillardia theta CCMP2712]|uniref:Uncharacterized protein n=1 Tax=Guillardia theta (strain CCMP2712) TaxID=905079 RepID=L1JZ80_GUITC|nr:hypothetical protein GUITHDRAFT_150257 [Guillardia theta CCMP2712]EKX53677.1 hypothetical protein GUITHDRAFT_150257 [Guillardia theta CCMP2712]|eukprot:XP_005840657.1 hypothetical protein GUITHDRAFT_150257 [Guillardia theta CCMP2712]
MQAIADSNALLAWVEQLFGPEHQFIVKDEPSEPLKELRSALRRGYSKCKQEKRVTFCVEITNGTRTCSDGRRRKSVKLSACTRRRSAACASIERSILP